MKLFSLVLPAVFTMALGWQITGCSAVDLATRVAVGAPTPTSVAQAPAPMATPTLTAAGPSPTPSLVVTRQVLVLGTATAPRSTPVPAPLGTSSPVKSAAEAIQRVQAKFPEVASFRPSLTPGPFDSDHAMVFDRGDRWDVVIWHGEGDCPAGCIDNYYYYYSAWRDGRVEKAGEFSRVLNRASNSYVERGTPLWGFPR